MSDTNDALGNDDAASMAPYRERQYETIERAIVCAEVGIGCALRGGYPVPCHDHQLAVIGSTIRRVLRDGLT